MKNYALLFLMILFLSSCVSKKKFTELQGSYDQLKANLENCEEARSITQGDLLKTQQELRDKDRQLASTETRLDNEQNRVKTLENEVDYLKKTNTSLLDRMSDLSVISKQGAESIMKSLDAINEQSKYIQDLNSSMQRKDSLNLALVMNLKRSLGDVNDDDVSVEVKKGVVYISLSDNMLFQSGSAQINNRALEVLGKIAKVVNDHEELDILVEGHTDTVPIKTDCLKDNWDLSAMRATAIVRTLQWRYDVAPERMTAGGRSQYIPKSDNATKQGRSENRRTEIVILPKLDQFFKLLEPSGSN